MKVAESGYGHNLHIGDGHKLPSKPSFAENPNPINLDVFENRGLYTNFVMIALAYDESRQVAENEEQLVNLVERYAYLGAAHLAETAKGKAPAEILSLFCKIMQGEAESILI